MGQPIVLKKDDKPDMVVYGYSQAAVFVAQGWSFENEDKRRAGVPADNLTKIPGVNEALAEALALQGIVRYAALSNAPIEDLTRVNGIGEKKAVNLKAAATRLLIP